ncbi:ATP-binding protein [Phycicoccus sp.]|uniref:uridine kinase family protein n=1 Tax=Phycicoccus sp. TaxID=1902410 RepID=UPI002BEEF2CC|nr:ATP-binding protein [Phycicoccus sp.]HMM93656.1 ATP-binding protein [Phycicoccus sp.]
MEDPDDAREKPGPSPESTLDSTPHATPDRRRVVVLAGPSGAGKSRLAHRLHAARGWPVFRLDDFYRDEDDPAMPRHPELGIVDWDHPDSWDGERAVAALHELLATGCTELPVYDISRSRAVGAHEVTARPDDLVLAEGIFAAEVVARLDAEGILHSAWCVHHRPAVTFVRRLLRDLRERRKAPAVLVRRGWRLMRDEPGIVARQTALGAVGSRAAAVEAHLLG